MAGNADLVVRVAANISALQSDMAAAAGSIKTIEEATSHASEAATHFAHTLSEIGAAMGIGLSIESAVEFFKTVTEEAKALQVLSLQSQINVEDLQVLAAATREYGVDGEQVGRAIYQLSRRIAGGDESVATAYHLMGMSIEQVKGLNQMDLFLTTERALGKLQGTIRDTAAADLYGGRLGVSMGAFSTGVDEAIDEAKRLNTIASKDSVEAAAEYERSIDRMTHSLHAFAIEQIGAVSQGFNVLADASKKGASTWAIFTAMIEDAYLKQMGMSTGTSMLTKLLDDLNQKTDDNTKKTKESADAHDVATVAMSAQTQAFHFMAALEIDSAKPILGWQAEYLGHLKEIGELTAKNAAGIGVNVEQFKAYEVSSRKAAEAEKERVKLEEAALLETTKLWDEYFALRVQRGGTANETAIAQIDKWASDLTAKMAKAGTDTTEFYDALAAVSDEKMKAVGIDWNTLRANSQETLDEMAKNARATYSEMLDGSLHFTREALDEQLKKTHEAEDAARGMGAAYVAANAAAAAAAAKAAAETERLAAAAEKAKAAMMAMGNTLDIGHAAQDPEIMALLKEGWSLANAEAIKLSRQWHFTPSLFDPMGNPETSPSKGERVPGYAGGVTNAPGGWAMVGERGPERMYVPPGANIYPSGSGGGLVVNVMVSGVFDPSTKRQLADIVGEGVIAKLRSEGMRL